jgi:hypothetical protein
LEREQGAAMFYYGFTRLGLFHAAADETHLDCAFIWPRQIRDLGSSANREKPAENAGLTSS